MVRQIQPCIRRSDIYIERPTLNTEHPTRLRRGRAPPWRASNIKHPIQKMRPLGAIKSLCFIGVVLAFNQQLCGQVVETIPGPILETRPENGTPIAATAETNSIFSPPRGMVLALSVVGGYDDNVNGSSIGKSASLYTSENASLSYTFGTPRTQVSLTTGGGIMYYFDRTGYNPSGYLGLSLTHKASRRMTLSLSVFAAYQTQPDLSTNLGSNQQLGAYIHSTDTISLAYSWMPRFSTVTSYTFGLLKYDSSAGSALNRMDHTFSEQFRYLLWPATTGVAEYRFGVINYESGPLDSTTHFLLAGLEHSFTPRLNASFRGGVELRSSESTGFQPGPYFESTLTYILRRNGSVIWTNNYSIEEADQPGASSRPSFRTGLTLNYGFTRRLSGSLALFYVHGGNQSGGGSSFGGSSTEDTLDIGPSLHYFINRRLSADMGYHYTEVESGSVFSSYSKNNFFAGLNFNF
jgi:Putative beta-barrel porin 2